MHIKHMHEMIERLTDCTKSAIENDQICVGKYPIADVVDMIKDLNEASYYASIVKAMEEAKKEDEEEEKHMLRMLKEEHGMSEEDSRRFYDAWRYKNGRFAPKGRGTRRGYEESYPAMMETYAPEYWRDLDRGNYNRMYYTNPSGERTGYSESGNTGRNSSSQSGNMNGNASGNVRGYSDGYSDGYREGEKNSKGVQSRYDKARRGYSESKERNKGNTQEENSENMRKLEEVLNTVKDDIKEYVPMMSASEKAMAKQKIDGICKMIS